MDNSSYATAMENPMRFINVGEEEKSDVDDENYFCENITYAANLCVCVFDETEITQDICKQSSTEEESCSHNEFNERLINYKQSSFEVSSQVQEKNIEPNHLSGQEINSTFPSSIDKSEEFILSDNGQSDFKFFLGAQNEKSIEPVAQKLVSKLSNNFCQVSEYDPKQSVKVLLKRLENEFSYNFLTKQKNASEQGKHVENQSRYGDLTEKKVSEQTLNLGKNPQVVLYRMKDEVIEQLLKNNHKSIIVKSLELEIIQHKGNAIKSMRTFSRKVISNGINVRRVRPKRRLNFYSSRKCRVCKKTFASFRRHKESTCKAYLPFQCKICFRDLRTEEGLNEHIISKCGTEKTFSCSVCNKKYLYKRNLIEHTTPVCHSLRRYKCTECPKSFQSSVGLRRHVHVSERNKFLCEICGELVCKKRYESHVMSHLNQRPYICNTCGKDYKTKEHLNRHKKMHSHNIQKNYYNCAECGKAFKNLSKLKYHLNVHGMLTLKRFLCRICGKKLTSNWELKEHLRIHSDLNSHCCKICKKCHISKAELEEHMKIHTDEKPHMCKICGHYFKTQRSLRRHSIIHSDLKSHCCEICKKCHISKAKLEEHMRIHTCEKPHICKICGQSFRIEKSLRTHSIIHSDLKPHCCEICKKSHISKAKLEEHMRIHTGEKPHICNVCGQSFRIRKGLRAHSIIHSDLKPHCCEICKKSFISKAKLEEHMRIHTGEKPHKCNACDKLFRTKPQLNKHFTVHHKKQLYSCTVCFKSFQTLSYLNDHFRIHSVEQPYVCKLCYKGYMTMESLVLHSKTCGTHFTMDKVNNNSSSECKYSCITLIKIERDEPLYVNKEEKTDICNNVFNTTKMSQKSDVCLPERNLICKELDDSQYTLSSLRNVNKDELLHHKNQPMYNPTSGSNKPFTCAVCKAAFKSIDSLSSHMILHDTVTTSITLPYEMYSNITNSQKNNFLIEKEEKCIKCHICEKLFNRKCELKRHYLSHSDLRQFECELCHKSFKYNSNLKQHIKSVHRNRNCNDSFFTVLETPGEKGTEDLLHNVTSELNEEMYLFEDINLWKANRHNNMMTDKGFNQLNTENNVSVESVVKIQDW